MLNMIVHSPTQTSTKIKIEVYSAIKHNNKLYAHLSANIYCGLSCLRIPAANATGKHA